MFRKAFMSGGYPGLFGRLWSKKRPGEDRITRKVKITDMAGRQVEVPVPAQKVVAIGPGALGLLCYVNGNDKIVGVEELERKQPTGRPYILAYPELKQLPVIGPGGPNSSPDAEKLVSVKSDVIFAASFLEKASADELQSKTNIPVVVLSYGQTTTFDDEVYKSISLIGQITGNEESRKHHDRQGKAVGLESRYSLTRAVMTW